MEGIRLKASGLGPGRLVVGLRGQATRLGREGPRSARRPAHAAARLRPLQLSAQRPSSNAPTDPSAENERDFETGVASQETGQLPWDWLNWEAYNQKFEVPWDGTAVWIGMTGWLLCSVTVAFLFIPLFIEFTGVTSSQFTAHQRVSLLFYTQTLETLFGLGIIYLATLGTLEERADPDVFKFSLSKPLERRYGWLIWAGIGISLSFVANILLSLTLNQLGLTGSGTGTVDAVADILSLDVPTYLTLVTVVGVLAPVLEETVFRGFLLTSLMKWMPAYQAVAVSSVIFGCVHLTAKDLPYLTVVGGIWGLMYVRSRNLATPMLMHCAWNSTMLTILYVLTAQGVDIKQLI